MQAASSPFVRSPDTDGIWKVNDRRYFENAHVLLIEFELVVSEINRDWPKPLAESVARHEISDALWKLTRRRNLLVDSIKIFSAMSVEAFLNFYGVLRLGHAGFDAKFERLGPIDKLKKLFELCDNIKLTNNDSIVQVVKRIAERRNELVHPNTEEVTSALRIKNNVNNNIPDSARESVADMVYFFNEFSRLCPGVSHHMPKPYSADA
jgi:hypothetical protein